MDTSKLLSVTGKMEDIPILKQFNDQNSSACNNDISKLGLAQLEYCELWNALVKVMQNQKLSQTSENICTYLTTLRILSRDKRTLCQVVDEHNVKLLLQLANLEEPSYGSVMASKHSTSDLEQLRKDRQEVEVEACKCLCNVIYQSSLAQGLCCTSQCMVRLVQALQSDLSHALTIGYIRLLFLVTALAPHTRKEAVVEHDALSVMLPLLGSEDPETTSSSHPPPPTMQPEAVERVVEVLKLLYNFCESVTSPRCLGGDELSTHMEADGSLRPEHERALAAAVTRTRQLLLSIAHTHQHTQLMHSHCINLLVCMPPAALAALTPSVGGGTSSWWGSAQQRRRTVYRELDVTAIVQILAFLHARLNAPEEQSCEKLTPVMTMMVTVCQSSRTVRKFVRMRVMPPLRDVTQRPEEGTSLRSRLVKLMTSPVIELKHLAATLLFVLCNRSVERLIKYSGYGNCAGLLASLGLLAGGSNNTSAESSDSEDSDTEEYDRVKHMVNPVTGCYEPVRPNPMEEMSEEQREYEAIKLVNALDKLIRSGNVKPCGVGPDGRPQPLEHVLQLQDCKLDPSATLNGKASLDEDEQESD